MTKFITALISFFLFNQLIADNVDLHYDGFDYIRKNSKGNYMLIAKQNDKYGVIDLFGNEIIKSDYSYIGYLEKVFLSHIRTLYTH